LLRLLAAIEAALDQGSRGLPGGSSLAKLLAEHRRVRNKANLPPLNRTKILEWAELHHRRNEKWPSCESGAIHGASGETWKAVQMALVQGLRGLVGSTSLAKLLAEERFRAATHFTGRDDGPLKRAA
jgi:hypothetical protein